MAAPSAASPATLASLLSAALADVERLKHDLDAATKRAVTAENLLRNLTQDDGEGSTANSNNNNNNANNNNNNNNGNNNNNNNNTTPNGVPLMSSSALNHLMQAEARATTAEQRLGSLLDATAELLRCEDRAADERRRIDDRLGDERRRLAEEYGLLSSLDKPSRGTTTSHASFSVFAPGGAHSGGHHTHMHHHNTLTRSETYPSVLRGGAASSRSVVGPHRSAQLSPSPHLHTNGVAAILHDEYYPRRGGATGGYASTATVGSSANHNGPPPGVGPGAAQLRLMLTGTSGFSPGQGQGTAGGSGNGVPSSRVRPRAGSDASGHPPTKRMRAESSAGMGMNGLEEGRSGEHGHSQGGYHHSQLSQSQSHSQLHSQQAHGHLHGPPHVPHAIPHGHGHTHHSHPPIITHPLSTPSHSHSHLLDEEDADGEEDELRSNGSMELDDLLLEVAGEREGGAGGGMGSGVGMGVKREKERRRAGATGIQAQAAHRRGVPHAPQGSFSQSHLKPHSHSPPAPNTSQSQALSQSQSQQTQSFAGQSSKLKASSLFTAVGLPPGGFPATNSLGQRTCRQCGQAGRYKDGKCVEKWGPGPEGPGTVCDRCRKKMKRVERRGDANATMLAQAQAQASSERKAAQAQAAAHAALSTVARLSGTPAPVPAQGAGGSQQQPQRQTPTPAQSLGSQATVVPLQHNSQSQPSSTVQAHSSSLSQAPPRLLKPPQPPSQTLSATLPAPTPTAAGPSTASSHAISVALHVEGRTHSHSGSARSGCASGSRSPLGSVGSRAESALEEDHREKKKKSRGMKGGGGRKTVGNGLISKEKSPLVVFSEDGEGEDVDEAEVEVEAEVDMEEDEGTQTQSQDAEGECVGEEGGDGDGMQSRTPSMSPTPRRGRVPSGGFGGLGVAKREVEV